MDPVRIHRERIAERLRTSAGKRVVLLVAGAGFGKSIAVRQSLDPAGSDAFYRVAPETATLLAFLRGLTDALEAKVPGAHLSLAIAYERAMQSPAPATVLATWLGEHLRDAALRIVIDDLHNAGAGAVPEFVRAGIEAAPESVRWVLATRDTATLPIASWLAHDLCDAPIDEAVLRFTSDETRALAASVAPQLPRERVDAIARITGGWPAAVGLALALGDGDLPDGGSLEATYDELARRTVDAAGEPQRTELLQSAIYVDGRFPYDSLFREYLLGRLREQGPELERSALTAAAADAEERGDVRTALKFYQQANMADSVNRVLVGHGVSLMNGGSADLVEAALAQLDGAQFDGGPAIMLLKAIRDAQLARLDSAEAWFQLAIAAAAGDEPLRVRIVYRYALDLLRRGRVDVIDVLEPVIQSISPDNAYHPLLCATLATAYAFVDRIDDARALLASAMSRLPPDLAPALGTRAFHQAAYVALRAADIPEARRYAERVLEVALPNGYYDLAARAHSILYEIEHAWAAEPQRALAHIESAAAYGLKAGDTHIRQWALLGAYYIEAERGNAAMMSTIERALNAPEVQQTTEDSNDALLPGQALRATWSGDFGHAYRLLANSAQGQVSADGRAGRWAEIALFGAAGGYEAAAREAVAAARNELTGGQTGKHGIQTVAYLLIALSLLDDRMTWRTLRDAMPGGTAESPAYFFVRVAEALHSHWYERRDHDAVLASLNVLRERNFGGIAAMLEALPAYPATALQTLP